MNIVTVRRISQGFFLALFFWFVAATRLGQGWYQLKGWPVNWLLQLDPLLAVATLLTTHTLYAGLLWSVAVFLLTLLIGRFFCSWVCPFGTIHHGVGYLAHRKKSPARKAHLNRYRKGHTVKYWILFFLLMPAVLHLAVSPTLFFERVDGFTPIAAAATMGALLLVFTLRYPEGSLKLGLMAFSILLMWPAVTMLLPMGFVAVRSIQTGLLDPIPLLYRTAGLAVLPILDRTPPLLSNAPRHYEGVWVIGALFFTAVFLNFWLPRFYCRVICPLGALFGLISRLSLWRIGKTSAECSRCRVCDAGCEGGCEPSGQLHGGDCVLCFNCLHTCPQSLIQYTVRPSAEGQSPTPDLSRREWITALVSGMVAIPLIRLDGSLADNWNPGVIRPPGSLDETRFLARCTKCGQCMRICPTNIIQPAGLSAGLEGIWTPVLNFRIGTSGCQPNCVACGNLCPTAAIRPITLDERLGRDPFGSQGPIRLGTAFVNRGRCLPWAMNRPCIVCQENCPVSPKAIVTREHFQSVLDLSTFPLEKIEGTRWTLKGASLQPNRFSTGDYYCRVIEAREQSFKPILGNSEDTLQVASDEPAGPALRPGTNVEILVRLQLPYVDPTRCIGCGICEHECPVSGRRAIRISAENESRNGKRSLLIRRPMEGTG
jgi:polyferredoxin/formate hydrogenlyase subunit 6/NADH:ubiquinone oxidoreductase subunit I